MKPFLKSGLKAVLKQFNVGITSHENLKQLTDFSDDMARLFQLPNEDFAKLLHFAEHSQSQLKQDLFVLSELQFKKNGFFVEFGATNGIELSNTYLLENILGWTGIVAEPARSWHQELMKNRSCHVETKCVWAESGKTLVFNEVLAKEYSTINSFSSADSHREIRQSGETYAVDTISLLDLLEKYAAPRTVDYLSIDTEGSEFDILQRFDFGKYEFQVITCEHNFTPMREEIHTLLTRNGYRRKFFALSRFDDWYVRS